VEQGFRRWRYWWLAADKGKNGGEVRLEGKHDGLLYALAGGDGGMTTVIPPCYSA
jgi:hypothetical protein